MGSKNGIAERVVECLPPATHLYDVFAGGCAVTHCAMLSGKYKRIHSNDLDGRGLRLFRAAIAGTYRNERRWIDRATFERLKATDPYIALVWSFGNNMSGYMYSQEIEPWKKGLHYARVFGDPSLLRHMGIPTDGSARDIIVHKDDYKRRYICWWLEHQEYSKQELDALIAKCRGDIAKSEEQLRQYLLRALRASGLTQAEVQRRLGTQMAGHYFGQSQWEFPTEDYYRKMQTFMPALDKDYNEVVGLHDLWQSLQSLQSLQRLAHLLTPPTFSDYRDITPEADSVLYCDPPYIGTAGYGEEGSDTATFDHAAFYEWCSRQTSLVVVSEYNMPSDRFACVSSVGKHSLLAGGCGRRMQERLYVPRHQLAAYLAAMKGKKGGTT